MAAVNLRSVLAVMLRYTADHMSTEALHTPSEARGNLCPCTISPKLCQLCSIKRDLADIIDPRYNHLPR
jgi:hypothetical protein